MKLTNQEENELNTRLMRFLKNRHVKSMEKYVQHGNVTTLSHCKDVARTSFWLNRRLHLHADEKTLLTGAMLHDFYLYDWHNKGDGSHRLHGFSHPGRASRNAKKYFNITTKEQEIIESHMWPLTITKVPKSKEAAIVSIADKICSSRETIAMRRKKSAAGKR